jgi:hypothetical protein
LVLKFKTLDELRIEHLKNGSKKILALTNAKMLVNKEKMLDYFL